MRIGNAIRFVTSLGRESLPQEINLCQDEKTESLISDNIDVIPSNEVFSNGNYCFSSPKESLKYNDIVVGLAELMPVLSAHLLQDKIFIVDNKCSAFRPSRSNLFIPTMIRLFFEQEQDAASLHHINKILNIFGKSMCCYINVFITDSDNQSMKKYVDTNYGTRFTYVTADGVWLGVSVDFNEKSIFVVVLFTRSERFIEQQFLSAIMYNPSNVVLCTSEVGRTKDMINKYKEHVSLNSNITILYFGTNSIESFRCEDGISIVRVNSSDKMPELKLKMYPSMCSTYIKSIVAQYATFIEFSDVHPKTILSICKKLVPQFDALKNKEETTSKDEKEKTKKKSHKKTPLRN